MNEDGNSKNPEPLARKEIPDSWGQSGRCPVCQTAPLQVVHLRNATDYLICTGCEMSFEVAANGSKIRIKNVPDALGFMEGELRYHWVEPSSLADLANNRRTLMAEKARHAAPGSLSDAEVHKRSLSLYRMGNKPKMVEFILVQAGATPEQAQAAFVRLKEQSELDAKSLTQKFKLAMGVLFFMIFACIVSWALMTNLIGVQLQQRLANPQSTVKQVIWPLQMLNSIPNFIKPVFLRFPPIRVTNSGPDASECPSNASDAAGLFGGTANLWGPINQPRGWQMTYIGVSSTVRVPEGMQVALVDNQTGKLSIFNGPVTLGNANFVAIRCH